MAVSAIGNPTSFEQTLAQIGATIVESLRYPDHHNYTARDMISIIDQARRQDVEAIVITEKDAVKVPQPAVLAEQDDMMDIPIYVLSIEVKLKDGADNMMELIKTRIQDKIGPAKPDTRNDSGVEEQTEVFAADELHEERPDTVAPEENVKNDEEEKQ